MIWLLKWLIWGPPPPPSPPEPSCKEGGPHRYFARYDEMIDPRISGDVIETLILMQLDPVLQRQAVMAKLYVKDICKGCGDVIERIEGMNAMEVLAHQSKRIAQ